MFGSRFSFSALITLVFPLLLSAAGRSTKPDIKRPAEFKLQAATQLAGLPLSFEPNRGQTDPSVTFQSNLGRSRFFLTRDSAVFSFRRPGKANTPPAVVRMRTRNDGKSLDEGFEKLPGVSNYFVGSDASKWVTGIPQFAKLRRQGVYPGVDMVFYGNQRQLEYDFVVAPGADPSVIELAYEGVDGIGTNASGDLVLATSAGEFIQKKPKVYQQFNGKQVEVASSYRIAADKSVHFELARYDRAKALVIDPVIVFNALVGSSGDEFARGIAVDSSLNIFVAGTTTGADFPLVSPYEAGSNAFNKVFVFKLNSTGTALLYSTYIGGESNDFAGALAIDSSGNAYIAGATSSRQFPVASAAQATYGGDPFDGFLTKLSSSGGSILYSTYAGGPNGDQIEGLSVDSGGNAYVTGLSSAGFPTTAGTVQPAFNAVSSNVSDCIVGKYNTLGQRVYATYLGGTDLEECFSIASDSSGNAYVSGRTQSSNFNVTPGAYQTTYHGGTDAFITKINSAGSALVYSTYFGGSGEDRAYAITVDSLGAAYITGSTTSANLPISAGAYQQNNLASSGEAFVAKFTAGGGLAYSTFLGGSSQEIGVGIAVDGNGTAYVVGITASPNFPVTSAVIGTKPEADGTYVGFATAINSAGTGLIYSTYLGGKGATSNVQYAHSIALDSSGNAYIVGQTDSPYFKNTAGALNAGYLGSDVFITKLSPGIASCVLSFPSSILTPYGSGATLDVEVFGPSGCSWTANPGQSWVTISPASATGTTSMTVAVAANPGAARSTTIGFSTGQSITVNQGPGGCTYSFSPTFAAVAVGGGSGSAPLTAGSGCTWNATSGAAWLTLSSPSGSGSAGIAYAAAANLGPAPRSAVITVNNATFRVTQNSSFGIYYGGSIDTASCAGITGWAADQNRLGVSITVSLWDTNNQISSVTANASRPDIGALIGDNGLHGFTLPIPQAYQNGVAHIFQVRFESSSVGLANSPVSLACGAGAGPTVVGVTPAGGSGTFQNFTFTFSSPSGYQSINLMDVLINNFLDGRQACYVAVVPAGPTSATVYLVNDAGASGGPFASMSLPGNSTVQNSQCVVSAPASSISGSGNTMVVTLSIQFKGVFAGNKIFYTSAASPAGNTGWQAIGTWNVPGSSSALSVGVTSPNHGTGNGIYTFTFNDANGYNDLTVLNVLTNNFIDGRAACYIAYLPSGPSSGTLLLVNDAGDSGGPFATMTIPGSGSIHNSQCTINAAGSSAIGSGTTLTLNLNYTFTTFSGNKIMYGAARNNNSSSDWQAVGSLTLP